MELIPMISIEYIELFVNRFEAFGAKFKRKSLGRVIDWNLQSEVSIVVNLDLRE